MARADRYTSLNDTTEYYSDFLSSFSVNPITHNLARVTNEDAVKQALRMLLLTNKGERLYDVNYGSKIRSMLFDLFGPDTTDNLKTAIQQAVAYADPRVNILEVSILDNTDQNNVVILIWFTTVNITQPIRLDLLVKRIR